MSEELQVIFHAVAKSRTDIVQQAISTLRSSSGPAECARLISTGRAADGATPLHLAVETGNPDVIRALLNAGADVTAETANGERPYDWATQDLAKQAFHVFLYEAIAMGNLTVIEHLLAGGLATTATLVDGSPMLCVAASFGNVQVAQALLKQGCSVDGLNSDGQTPLHIACKEQNAQLVQILLDEGASVDSTDSLGRTPADMLSPTAPDVVRELLQSPPAPTFRYSADLRSGVEAALQQLSPSLQSASQDSHHTSGSHSRGMFLSGLRSRAGSGSQQGQQYQQQQHGLSSALSEEDEDCLEEDGFEAGDTNSPSGVKLVLWPAPQRQRRKMQQGSFSFSSASTVGIAADSSLLGPTSLLVETLSSFQINCEVTPAGAGAAIRLSIDRNACPGWNRYDLVIDPRRIHLTASDPLGLRYGVQCLVQILKLHSQVSAPASAPSELTLYVPCLIISDWPDVENRAVLWSCRQQAESSLAELKAAVSLMTECRLNMLFLAVDPDTEDADWAVDDDEQDSRARSAVSLPDFCCRSNPNLLTVVMPFLTLALGPHTISFPL